MRLISRALSGTLLSLVLASAWGQSGVVPTMGKEFWLGFMTNYGGNPGQSLDIFISSPFNTTGNVIMPLTGINIPFSVTANTTTTVSLTPAQAMHQGSDVVDNKSVLIVTADTVAVFAINFEQYTADGQVVYPVQSIGDDYRILAYQGLGGFIDLVSEFLVVATEDDTQVEITTTALTQGGHAAGVPWIVDLDSGETYQVRAQNSTDDFTGTTIKGTAVSGTCRPFAVFSGSVCTNIPVGCTACDHICEQNLPVNAWGTTYYSVPFATTTSYSYKILSNTNGTQVSVNGAAPILLNAGQVSSVANFAGPACFTGNQPFAVAQYMQGVSCSGAGDPALLILNAEEQKINDITFSTVGSTVITDHYLNLIVATASTGSVILDGAPVPVASFNTFPACPTHSYAQLPLAGGAAGVSHTLNCPTGIIGYVYGMGSAESYAYSVGAFTPVPPIIVDTVLCGLDSTGTITLSPPNFLWNPFWTTISDPTDTLYWGYPYTFTPPGSDIYVVTGNENLSLCQEQYFFSIEIDTPPALVTTASSTTVCAYEQVQLNVTPTPGGTYLYNWWPDAELNDGSLPNPVATPSQSGWFFVSVSTLNGCAVALDSIYITVTGGDILVHDAATAVDELCLGDSSQLTLDVQRVIADDLLNTTLGTMWTAVNSGMLATTCGSVGGDALYFDGPAPRQAETIDLDVSLGGTVRFSLLVSDGVAPCEDADAGDNIVLEYSTNSGGAWNPIATYFEYNYPTFTLIDAPIPAGAQTVSTRFRWRQVGVYAPGQDNWSLDNVAIAVKDPANMTFSWTPSATLSSGSVQDPMAYPTSSGWYYVTTDDLLSTCVYNDSVYIDVGLPFTISMIPDTGTCDAGGLQLWATPGIPGTYSWAWTPITSLSASFIENPVATPVTTTEYFVTVENAQGCSATDSVTITVNNLLGLNVTASDVDLCQGETSNLTAVVIGGGTNLSYTWTPGAYVSNAGISNPVASPVAPTWFFCTVVDTLAGCTLIDSIFIDVNMLYLATATEDTVVCTTAGLQLNVVHNIPAPYTISWTPAAYLSGSSTATPTILFDSTAQYIVQVEDNIGCSAFDTVNVTVAFATMQIWNDSSLCAGDSAYLDAGFPWATHSWAPGGQTTQGIWVSTAGVYTVTMQDSTGCQIQHATTITVDQLPVVNIGPDTSRCVGETWTLNAGNPGSTYLWSPGGQVSQVITISTSATYSVQVTDGNDCVNDDAALVTFDPLPVIVLSDTNVCVSEVITLDAGNPGSWYQWSTGATTQSITIGVNSGTYSVVVTTTTWCTDSADADLTFVPFPVVDLGPDSALCDLENITLDAGNPTASFAWHDGTSAQTNTFTDDAITWVDVYNGYCTTRDSCVLVFNPLPLYVLPASITTCLDYPPHYAVLDARNADCTFQWSNGETSGVILAQEYGWYTVHITTPLNCSIDDSVLVDEYCFSTIYVPNTFTPDGDGMNELFFATGTNIDPQSMELMIFDRWGEMIHTGTGGNAYWDATVNGTPVQDGVYVWKVKYRFITDVQGSLSPEYEEVGHVTVLR